MNRIMDSVVRIVVAALVAFWAAGCRPRVHDEVLRGIGVLVEADGKAALDSLNAVDRDGLSDGDRHYYDFLKLKGEDKTYVTHTSDSIIMGLMDYYRGTDMEAEVTYYAGRVYCDLGDFPTALRYFQDALDATDGDQSMLWLRSRITSQTGRLLNDLRLYREAIPYLEETIELNQVVGDTIYEALNYQLLGAVYMHLKEYDAADEHFRKALSLARNEGDSALIQGYLAASKFQRGENKDALLLIRGVTERSNPLDRDFLLSYAADIYLNAGITDTAFIYANELKQSKKPKFNRGGYEILLRPELSNYSSKDSISIYAQCYTNSMNDVFNEHGAQAAMMQNTMYNYALHDREKERIAAEKQTLQRWLLIAGVAVVGVAFMAVYYKYREAMRRVQQMRVENLLLTLEREHKETLTELSRVKEGLSMKEMLKKLSERMQSRALKEMSRIAESEAYGKIVSALKEDRIIQLNDSVWQELDESVRRESRSFDEIVSGSMRISLTDMEYAVLLLTKSGFSSTEASRILGRAKNSLSHQRNQLRKKVFFDQIDKEDLAKAIRML